MTKATGSCRPNATVCRHVAGFPCGFPFKPVTRRVCYTQTQRANGARAGASADGGPVWRKGLCTMVFDFLKGEFIDVISWLDDTRDTMVWRFDRRDQAIKYGAKLTVREGQAAVFIHEGQLADVFGPGLYMLETNNLPIMTTLQHWDHGFSSPVQIRGLFRLDHPVQRPEMGHQEPDHGARPGIRSGPPARLWHLFDARHRPGPLHDRNRRHRR